MGKLSPTMQKTLDTIVRSGGEAHPEMGGWWRDRNGHRLSFPVNDYRKIHEVGTNTIFALLRRGLIEPIPNSGNRVHCAYKTSEEANQ